MPECTGGCIDRRIPEHEVRMHVDTGEHTRLPVATMHAVGTTSCQC